MTSKIKIKMGAIEIEYEGSEEFLKEELPELLSAVSDLYQRSTPILNTEENVENNNSGNNNQSIQGTTNTLIAKLGGSTGPELAMAAAARITFVLNKDKFSRKELLEEMQSASAYYKSSYSANLTKTINKLVKDGKFMEPAKGTYSLGADSIFIRRRQQK